MRNGKPVNAVSLPFISFRQNLLQGKVHVGLSGETKAWVSLDIRGYFNRNLAVFDYFFFVQKKTKYYNSKYTFVFFPKKT